MPEYIERKIATNVIGNIDTSHPYDDKDDIVEQAIGLIDHIPSADVAPVRHGRWEDSTDEWLGTDVYTCSKCRESYVLVEGTPKENLWHYCPNCGAKIDGGNEDAV